MTLSLDVEPEVESLDAMEEELTTPEQSSTAEDIDRAEHAARSFLPADASTADDISRPDSLQAESVSQSVLQSGQPAEREKPAVRQGLYIAMFSIHGLVRGTDLELGRDADTGGQVKYVVELARALSDSPEVARVDLFTRQVIDPKVDPIYARPEEQIAPKAHIIRLLCGPRRYLRKEVLWPYLDQYADQVLKYFRRLGMMPDILHAHYADAGYVGSKLSYLLGTPLFFTGHSLGRIKKKRLLDKGLSEQRIIEQYNIDERIEAEEIALSTAVMVVASTKQEVEEQYALYDQYQTQRMYVVPPGIDLKRFHPPRGSHRGHPVMKELARFLHDPRKPMILALARPDERKNLATLVRAYAQHPELRTRANLVLVMGTRDDLQEMETPARRVLENILYLIDKYDLYGSVAYPKHHHPDDIPEFYRLAAGTRGVLVNPTISEGFGLILLEAAASGLPIVATDDGGPRDIVANCQNGILVNPFDSAKMGEAIYEILNDRKRWKRLSKNGLRGVKQYYFWSSHVRNYLGHAKKFINRKKQRPPWITTGKKLLQAERLLITDIDNTLIGDDDALGELIRRIESSSKNVGFGIATGRNVDSVLELLDERNVLRPDILITAVGTEIYYGHSLQEDHAWKKHIHYRWEPDRIRRCVEELPGIILQPPEAQRDHKISYFIDHRIAPKKREILRLIRENRLYVKVIFSHQQYLDFLPQRASKGLAVWYLSNKWGIPMEHILVAGDSGNDEEMLTSNVLGVVVGNYSPELERLRNNPRIYFAEATYAAGILEGIDHYNFLGAIRSPEEELSQ